MSSLVGVTIGAEAGTTRRSRTGDGSRTERPATWRQRENLSPAESGSDDTFGYPIATTGSTALVGSIGGAATTNRDSGSVYVYERTSDAWRKQAKLTPDDRGSTRVFGTAVALADSGDTALIAVRKGVPLGGEVHVYERAGGEWTKRTTLSPPVRDTKAYFGAAVALTDGGDTALVGSHGARNTSGERTGAAFVFERGDGEWAGRAKLVDPDGDSGDRFGNDVALDGDTAFIGAESAGTSDGKRLGAAHVFDRTDEGWTHRSRLAADDSQENDLFGTAVAVDADTALVGAPFHGGQSGSPRGAAYVFVRADGAWQQRSKLTADGGNPYDLFGENVALDGDTVLVGSYSEANANGENAGAAYLFEPTGWSWTLGTKLTDVDGSDEDRFGSALAIDERTAFVGAPGDDTHAGENAGTACIFTNAPVDGG